MKKDIIYFYSYIDVVWYEINRSVSFPFLSLINYIYFFRSIADMLIIKNEILDIHNFYKDMFLRSMNIFVVLLVLVQV